MSTTTTTRPERILTLDVATLTLAEAAAIEQESGRSVSELMAAGPGSRRLVAAYIAARREAHATGTLAPSWEAVGAWRLLDG